MVGVVSVVVSAKHKAVRIGQVQLLKHILVVIKMAAMEGSLSKWTNVMIGWQYRWFVLDDNAGLLSYYTVSN